MIWTDEAVQRLEQIRAEGLTWADVARRLTREFGHSCSRQAVEGKWNRIRKAAGKPKHLRVDWWDQENRTQRFIEMWNATNGAAMTAGQIAKQLGTTRNAVLGKAHRLKQKGVHMVAKDNGHNGTTRKSTKRKKPKATPSRSREQNAVDAGHAQRAANARQRAIEARTEAKAPEPVSEPMKSPKPPKLKKYRPVLFQHLSGDCCLERVNSHAETAVWCCGLPTPPGSAYCEHHAELARRN